MRLRVCAFLAAVALANAASEGGAGAEVEKAWISPGGQVVVQEADGKIKNIAKDPEQVSARSLSIAPDRRSVAWLAEMPNCCTSYPVPLALVVFRPGQKLMRLGGNGQAIWGWAFRQQGAQVAFHTGSVHGGDPPNFRLHDTRTGRLVDTWVGREESLAPAWAKGLNPR